MQNGRRRLEHLPKCKCCSKTAAAFMSIKTTNTFPYLKQKTKKRKIQRAPAARRGGTEARKRRKTFMEQAVLAPHPHNTQLTHCRFLSRLLSITLASARKLSWPISWAPKGRGGAVRATAREGGKDRQVSAQAGGWIHSGEKDRA